MGVATERWSDKKVKQTITGNWVYTRGWDVIDFIDEDDAVGSVGVATGDQHPLNQYLICIDVQLVENKLTLAHVVATYEVTSLVNNPPDPVSRPPVIRWRWGKTSQEVDSDQNGNPILNAAGDAFKRNVKRNFSVRYLTLTRFEMYYDQDEAEQITDTTNNGAITFEGTTFDAGQVYCLSYQPVEESQVGALYLKVAYEFEIRTPNTPTLTDLQIRYPFQPRILNQGQRCQYYNADLDTNCLGHLYLSSGEAVKQDVLLDETGVPLDASIKVTQGMLDAVAQTLPDTVQPDVTDTAVFLIYIIYPEIDFSQIGVS